MAVQLSEAVKQAVSEKLKDKLKQIRIRKSKTIVTVGDRPKGIGGNPISVEDALGGLAALLDAIVPGVAGTDIDVYDLWAEIGVDDPVITLTNLGASSGTDSPGAASVPMAYWYLAIALELLSGIPDIIEILIGNLDGITIGITGDLDAKFMDQSLETRLAVVSGMDAVDTSFQTWDSGAPDMSLRELFTAISLGAADVAAAKLANLAYTFLAVFIYYSEVCNVVGPPYAREPDRSWALLEPPGFPVKSAWVQMGYPGPHFASTAADAKSPYTGLQVTTDGETITFEG